VIAILKRWFGYRPRPVDPLLIATRDRVLQTIERAKTEVFPDDAESVAELEAEASFVRRIAAGGAK
jgi:hypothetical protein